MRRNPEKIVYKFCRDKGLLIIHIVFFDCKRKNINVIILPDICSCMDRLTETRQYGSILNEFVLIYFPCLY